jgi:hypothetical protein
MMRLPQLELASQILPALSRSSSMIWILGCQPILQFIEFPLTKALQQESQQRLPHAIRLSG